MPSSLSFEEIQRRRAILAEIDRRIATDGVRVSRHYADRARQFMPFAALRGYSEMVRSAEDELLMVEMHELSEEEAKAMSETVQTLERGDAVTLTVYDEASGSYQCVTGRIDEVVEPLGAMRVSDRWIPFDRIGMIEKS